MPSIERFTRHFNRAIFKERLQEDKRLDKLEMVTINEAEIDNVQTDDSEDEEQMDQVLADMDICDMDVDSDLEEMDFD